jgi:hypothetical protein
MIEIGKSITVTVIVTVNDTAKSLLGSYGATLPTDNYSTPLNSDHEVS